MADDIIEKIKNANGNSLNTFRASKFINKIEYIQTKNLKVHCEILIFIVTENYIKSDLFKQHLNEAIELNKNIVFLFQDTVKFNDEKHYEKYKTFKLNKQQLESFQRFEELKNFEMDSKSFFKFFLDLNESFSNSKVNFKISKLLFKNNFILSKL